MQLLQYQFLQSIIEKEHKARFWHHQRSSQDISLIVTIHMKVISLISIYLQGEYEITQSQSEPPFLLFFLAQLMDH